MPKRIQRKRTKGWRMPEGAVYVGRPTKWGNPYGVVHVNGGWQVREGSWGLRLWAEKDDAALEAMRRYAYAIHKGWHMLPSWEEIRAELAGKDLACWCPLVDGDGNPVPCHADVLLEIANGEAS